MITLREKLGEKIAQLAYKRHTVGLTVQEINKLQSLIGAFCFNNRQTTESPTGILFKETFSINSKFTCTIRSSNHETKALR